MRYSPRIWQNGSFPFSVLHQLGKRVILSSNIFRAYASRICQNVYINRIFSHWDHFFLNLVCLELTVNSVTWMKVEFDLNIPASSYIDRIKETHVVDLPSLYTHSSCSGIVNNLSKDMPRFSVSARILGKSKFWNRGTDETKIYIIDIDQHHYHPVIVFWNGKRLFTC